MRPKLRATSGESAPRTMIAKLFTLLIRVYQLTLSKAIVALAGPVCRFEPSCSHYAIACITSHGALRGSLLSLIRLCKCHPFHPGGFDPPPIPKRTGGPSWFARLCRANAASATSQERVPLALHDEARREAPRAI